MCGLMEPGRETFGSQRLKQPSKAVGKLAELYVSIISWVKRYAGLLGLKEFDTSTAEGRSRERYRRVALTAYLQPESGQ